ncbi:MAG: PTS sugar transporter subunit IIB [Firmicutes bacterium]|nr:PTS sugar transporter subunit IIB [Candidatus Colivicinus equi]
MGLKLVRIDDRLIHGQVAFAWIKESQAKYLVVADDIVMKDSMQQMLLRLAAPKTIELHLLGLEDAVKFCNEHDDNSVFLICRNPENMLKLVELGLNVSEINLGNISLTKSDTPRKTLLKNIHVTENDVACLRAIAGRGIKVYIKLIPEDNPMDAIELLDKKY